MRLRGPSETGSTASSPRGKVWACLPTSKFRRFGEFTNRRKAPSRASTPEGSSLFCAAATFVGLGVFLLVGYNWALMPAPLKVSAIFATLIGTHAAGVLLRYQYGWRRASEIAFFLGCLIFGAAIFLLAQIFNIASSNYDAIWWWAICTLPFALLLDTTLLHLLFAALLGMWLGFEVLSLDRLFWGVPIAGLFRTVPSRPRYHLGVSQELG